MSKKGSKNAKGSFCTMDDDKELITKYYESLRSESQELIMQEYEEYCQACDNMIMSKSAFHIAMSCRIRAEHMASCDIKENEKTLLYRKQELKEIMANKPKKEDASDKSEYNKQMHQYNRKTDALKRVIARLEAKINSALNRIMERHKQYISNLKRKEETHIATDSYARKVEAKEKREKNKEKAKERRANMDSILNQNKSKAYLRLTRYELIDGAKVRMTREREGETVVYERLMTVNLARVLMNLKRYKSEDYYDDKVWPMVYDARDYHLVRINRFMLGHDSDVQQEVEPFDYQRMIEYEEYNAKLNVQILQLESERKYYLEGSHKYTEVTHLIGKVRDRMKDIVKTSVIVEDGVFELAHRMVIVYGNWKELDNYNY